MQKLLENISLILRIYGLMRLLNKTRFIDNPITLKELYEWFRNHGIKKVHDDLRQYWDYHVGNDESTL